jgi:hypothetical protein
MGEYEEAMADCDDAVEASGGQHWLPYHNRGLVAKLQAQAERQKEVCITLCWCQPTVRPSSYLAARTVLTPPRSPSCVPALAVDGYGHEI